LTRSGIETTAHVNRLCSSDCSAFYYSDDPCHACTQRTTDCAFSCQAVW
jgi:hypothetical protein